MKHFDERIDDAEYTLDNVAKKSIQYTINKFKVFIPYTIIIVPLACIFNWITAQTSKDTFLNMILEILFLSRSDKNVGTLWFLNAMFVVFPIFCCLCQMKSKHFVYIISFLYVLLYYEKTGVAPLNAEYPDNITRAVGGLLLGVAVYGFVEYLNRIELSRKQRIVLTILEEVSLIMAYLLVYLSRTNTKFILFIMTVGMIGLLSNRTYTNCIHITLFDWLGKFSMVIFMIHLLIADFINAYIKNLTNIQINCLYYGSSIILGIILYFAVERMKKKLTKVLSMR